MHSQHIGDQAAIGFQGSKLIRVKASLTGVPKNRLQALRVKQQGIFTGVQPLVGWQADHHVFAAQGPDQAQAAEHGQSWSQVENVDLARRKTSRPLFNVCDGQHTALLPNNPADRFLIGHVDYLTSGYCARSEIDTPPLAKPKPKPIKPQIRPIKLPRQRGR